MDVKQSSACSSLSDVTDVPDIKRISIFCKKTAHEGRSCMNPAEAYESQVGRFQSAVSVNVLNMHQVVITNAPPVQHRGN